jgi:hypothetical protein
MPFSRDKAVEMKPISLLYVLYSSKNGRIETN